MLEDIKNYRKISDLLHTAAQPSVDQFEFIKKASIDLVINLALSDSPGAIADEQNIVQAYTMDYIHMPVDFKSPETSDLEYFFQIMDKNKEKNILIHCAYNWRVSCFIYLYRAIIQDYDNNIAKQDMLDVWQPNKTWQTFISTCLTNKYDFKIYQ